jgi:hypothetical protein
MGPTPHQRLCFIVFFPICISAQNPLVTHPNPTEGAPTMPGKRSCVGWSRRRRCSSSRSRGADLHVGAEDRVVPARGQTLEPALQLASRPRGVDLDAGACEMQLARPSGSLPRGGDLDAGASEIQLPRPCGSRPDRAVEPAASFLVYMANIGTNVWKMRCVVSLQQPTGR